MGMRTISVFHTKKSTVYHPVRPYVWQSVYLFLTTKPTWTKYVRIVGSFNPNSTHLYPLKYWIYLSFKQTPLAAIPATFSVWSLNRSEPKLDRWIIKIIQACLPQSFTWNIFPAKPYPRIIRWGSSTPILYSLALWLFWLSPTYQTIIKTEISIYPQYLLLLSIAKSSWAVKTFPHQSI